VGVYGTKPYRDKKVVGVFVRFHYFIIEGENFNVTEFYVLPKWILMKHLKEKRPPFENRSSLIFMNQAVCRHFK
jgi:hypothetical protein